MRKASSPSRSVITNDWIMSFGKLRLNLSEALSLPDRIGRIKSAGYARACLICVGRAFTALYGPPGAPVKGQPYINSREPQGAPV